MGEPNATEAIRKAIEAAIEYERRVKAVYADAVAAARGEVARKVFGVLAEEEQGHVEFLEDRLARLRRSGRVEPGAPETRIPTKEAIEAARGSLEKTVSGGEQEGEADLLRRALAVELETSEFYRRMVSELPAEGQALFRPFLAIEDGHVAIVEAELDSVTGLGFWFDVQEFDLEAG